MPLSAEGEFEFQTYVPEGGINLFVEASTSLDWLAQC